jgi:hypothetical protein
VTKTYRRENIATSIDAICAENNPHVFIGKGNYVTSADGLLMPARQGPAAARPSLLQADAETAAQTGPARFIAGTPVGVKRGKCCNTARARTTRWQVHFPIMMIV